MIRSEECWVKLCDVLKKKGKAIIIGTFILQAVVAFSYLIYYFVKQPVIHSAANNEFYVVVIVSLVIFNLMFLLLGVCLGYVVHIVSYLIVSLLMSFVFDYVVYAIADKKSMLSHTEWIMFLVGGIIMPVCLLVQVVIIIPIYRMFKEETMRLIGISNRTWEIYWHSSLLKSMCMLQELLYLYMSFFSLMYQASFYLDIIMEVVIMIVYTIQSAFGYMMIKKSKIAYFPGWIILNIYSFIYMIFKVTCIYKDKTLSWANIGVSEVDLKDHYIASTTIFLVLILVFILSMVGGIRCLGNLGTVEHKTLIRKLANEDDTPSSVDGSFEFDTKDN